MEIRYQNEVAGFNMRMTEIHAALGNSQLKRLKDWTEQRIENASFYLDNIVGLENNNLPSNSRHVYHQFTIRVTKDREKFAEFMNKNGIDTGVYYPTPCHKLQAYNMEFSLPNTELACSQVISIPVHQNLQKRDLKKIASLTNEFNDRSEK
jgi:dTDP-4-amino-4,6-dideoxygalactose transaminase